MNQNKVGKFIATCRKERNMTQQELANQLHVTDRAISNWENGRRIPDVSFFKPLCAIFDISVNELMNGEKLKKEKDIASTNERLIHTLHVSNKKIVNIIRVFLFCLFLSFFILLSIYTYYKKNYPKIDIYHLSFSLSDPDKEYEMNRKFAYKMGGQKKNVYYYGVDTIEICDLKEKCYSILSAIEHRQTNMAKIKTHLESQYAQNHLQQFILYDGGTTIYEGDGYSIIFCNTLEGNQDIYFGVQGMFNKLNGAYCGKDAYLDKSFTRTYVIISATEDEEDDFINVTLKQFQGEEAVVKINKSSNIVVGKTYEFTFNTFFHFEDTIQNIFMNSTLLEVKETDKVGLEQINDAIFVNERINNGAELNEVDQVSMSIEKDTLTNTGMEILITDRSGLPRTYSGWFRVDKRENGKWIEAEKTDEEYGFTMQGYMIDKNNQLRMRQDWAHMYKPLKKGEYRLVKEVDGKYFSVEFMIEK